MEFELIALLATRENYYRFRPFIGDGTVSKYTLEILKALDKYFTARGTVASVDWGNFRTYFSVVLHPKLPAKEAELYTRLFDRLQTEAATADVDELLKSLIIRKTCTEIVNHVMDNSGIGDLSLIREAAEKGLDEVSSASEDDVVSDDLDSIVKTYFGAGGFSWRLGEFDKAVGPLRPGDFIVIGARPETGKTSFVTSVLKTILDQDKSGRPALFLNNEEDSRKVQLRMYSVVLNKSSVDLVKDAAKSKADYDAAINGRFKIIDVTGKDAYSIEALIRKHKPSVVVFNVLDKVTGFYKAGNETERLRVLANWARDLGKKYDCVVFAVAQADASAEGQMYPEQSQLYGSKTGIPGEADLLLMMGVSNDPKMTDFRFINICKNKLPGDAGTDPALKHHKFALKFNAVTGRFSDV